MFAVPPIKREETSVSEPSTGSGEPMNGYRFLDHLPDFDVRESQEWTVWGVKTRSRA
jgi:hypothetical protein